MKLPFGQALKRFMKAAGLNQRELAKEVGTSQATVSRWSSQTEPDIDEPTLVRLSDILSVPLAQLRSGTVMQPDPLAQLEMSEFRNAAVARIIEVLPPDDDVEAIELIVDLLTAFQDLDLHDKQLILDVVKATSDRRRAQRPARVIGADKPVDVQLQVEEEPIDAPYGYSVPKDKR